MKNGIKIISAKYIDGYKIEITFNDGKVNIFDYESLVLRNHEESIPYRDINKFKKFKIISNTEIAWGKDWDMILPLHIIYSKSSISNAGRKKIDDKKSVVRLFINRSVIERNGGIDAVKEKCISVLT